MNRFGQFFAQYGTIVWVRLFGEGLTSLTSSMIAPFMILYLNEKLGSTVTSIMLVVALQPLSDIVVTLIAGGITDRLGRKPVLLFSLLLQALAMTGMALATSLHWFALMYVLNGVGRSFYIPAQRAQLADATSPQQRAQVFALLSTVGYVGAAVGPILGLSLYRLQPAISFLLAALSLMLYAAVIWRKVPETAPLFAESGTTPHKARNNAAPSGRRLVIGMMLLSLPISLFYAQAETNFQLHVKSSFPDYVSTLALLSTVKGVLVVALELWLVKRTEQLPPRISIVAAYLAYAAAACLYGVADNLPTLLLSQLLIVIGESVGLIQLLKLVSLIAPADKRGQYFSLYGIHWDISRTAGPYLGSLILLQAGGTALFLLITALLLIGSAGQLLLLKKTFPLHQEG